MDTKDDSYSEAENGKENTKHANEELFLIRKSLKMRICKFSFEIFKIRGIQ